LINVTVYERDENGGIRSKTLRLEQEEAAQREAFIGPKINFSSWLKDNLKLEVNLFDLYQESKKHPEIVYDGVPYFEYRIVQLLVAYQKDPEFTYLRRLFRKISKTPENYHKEAFEWIKHYAIDPHKISAITNGYYQKDLLKKLADIKKEVIEGDYSPTLEIFEAL